MQKAMKFWVQMNKKLNEKRNNSNSNNATTTKKSETQIEKNKRNKPNTQAKYIQHPNTHSNIGKSVAVFFLCVLKTFSLQLSYSSTG